MFFALDQHEISLSSSFQDFKDKCIIEKFEQTKSEMQKIKFLHLSNIIANFILTKGDFDARTTILVLYIHIFIKHYRYILKHAKRRFYEIY